MFVTRFFLCHRNLSCYFVRKYSPQEIRFFSNIIVISSDHHPYNRFGRRYFCTETKRTLELNPHLDFKFWRNHLEATEANIKARNSQANVREAVAKYEEYINIYHRCEHLRQRRNEIADILKRGAESSTHRTRLIEEGKTIKNELSILSAKLSEVHAAMLHAGLQIPNQTHPAVPRGGVECATLLRTFGTKPKFSFTPRDHLQLSQILGLLDFNTASIISGAKFYYAFNEAALLELALINWAMHKVTAKGFVPVLTPDIVREAIAEGCGFQPRSEATQIYSLRGFDRCLVGTAEIPLAAMYYNKIIPQEHLPLKFVAYGHCFRAEAAQGAAHRGLYRVHQFSKVEMFIFCTPQQSEAFHQELLKIQCEILSDLGLHCRVLDMPTADLGAAAYRKFDIEAWMPSRNDYGEVTSASNCTDYQSRRLNIRYKPSTGGSTNFVHTLNGTALATPRILLALLETNQQEDGSVLIPQVLVPYMGGRTKILPKSQTHLPEESPSVSEENEQDSSPTNSE
jgi:seryl-tRNA synthetase